MQPINETNLAQTLDVPEESVAAVAVVYPPPHDIREHVWWLWHALLMSKERFSEFQTLLSIYPTEPSSSEEEPEGAAALRARINRRVTEWLGRELQPLSASEILLFRELIIEQRMGIGISPWKESNAW